MNPRNTLISFLNRLGIYNPARNLYFQIRGGNAQRGKFLSQFAFKGSLCFDVGANIGEMTDLFCSNGAKVIAIEPQKDCATYLRDKYRSSKSVIVVEKAVSGAEGTSEMYTCEANQLSTLSKGWMTALQESGRFGELPLFKKALVQTTTLESLIAEFGKPDFLKIDVEGGEFEVIRNLKAAIPCVCFEFAFPESRQSFELCIRHLDGLGDAVYNMSYDDKGFIFPEWSSSPKLFESLQGEYEKNSCGNIYVKYKVRSGAPCV